MTSNQSNPGGFATLFYYRDGHIVRLRETPAVNAWHVRLYRADDVDAYLNAGRQDETTEAAPEPVCIDVGNWYYEYKCPRCEATWVQNDDASTQVHVCARASEKATTVHQRGCARLYVHSEKQPCDCGAENGSGAT